MTYKCPKCGRLWNYDQNLRFIYKVFPHDSFHYEDEKGYIIQLCPKCAGEPSYHQSVHRVSLVTPKNTHTLNNIDLKVRSKGIFIHN